MQICQNHSLHTVTKVQIGNKAILVFCPLCEEKAPSDCRPFTKDIFHKSIHQLEEILNETFSKLIQQFNDFKEKYYDAFAQIQEICDATTKKKPLIKQLNIYEEMIDPDEQIIKQRLFMSLREIFLPPAKSPIISKEKINHFRVRSIPEPQNSQQQPPFAVPRMDIPPQKQPFISSMGRQPSAVKIKPANGHFRRRVKGSDVS